MDSNIDKKDIYSGPYMGLLRAANNPHIGLSRAVQIYAAHQICRTYPPTDPRSDLYEFTRPGKDSRVGQFSGWKVDIGPPPMAAQRDTPGQGHEAGGAVPECPQDVHHGANQ